MWYKVKRIMLGTQQVRPSLPIPTDWLLAYYPLKSDANDHKSDLWVSWTTYNGTWGWTANYWTVWWKTAALFSKWSNYINTWLTRTSTPTSIALFFYHTTGNDWETPIGNPSWNSQYWYAIRSGNSGTAWRVNNWTWTNKVIPAQNSNEWINLVLTIDSWHTEVYKDWVSIFSENTGTNASWGSFYIASYWTCTGYWFNGYIRDVMIFNKILTAQDALNYSNYFK